LALVAALALGFAAAKTREMVVAAPLLDRPIVAHLSGRVESLDWRDKGVRIVLSDLRTGRFRDGHIPENARIVIRSGGENLKPGQGVELTAQLQPPPGPSEPGDADPGRAAYFLSIGADGFAYGKPGLAPVMHAPGLSQAMSEAIETLRLNMTARIRAGLPGSRGAIASALITGIRGGIEAEDQAALRDAGLAHVLAIAGLHMALVGMGLFWLVRAFLVLLPGVALQFPIKKWAAGAALAGAGFYLVISGAAASATRAYVMLAMMLVAVLLDRPALSMRNLGWPRRFCCCCGRKPSPSRAFKCPSRR
jgi:competence protein ComEC